MSFAEFAAAIARGEAPPAGLSGAVRALWLEAGDDWHAAHTATQEDPTAAGAWVHAYLHRKEGDGDNAGYWYARARRAAPAEGVTLAQEWEQIARALLGDPAKS